MLAVFLPSPPSYTRETPNHLGDLRAKTHTKLLADVRVMCGSFFLMTKRTDGREQTSCETEEYADVSPLDGDVDVRHVLQHPVDDPLQVVLPHVLRDRLQNHNGRQRANL